jgi:hypothetical protein
MTYNKLCDAMNSGNCRSQNKTSRKRGSSRKPGRPRKRWLDGVTKDLEVLGLRGWRRRYLDREEWAKAVGEAMVLHGR